MKTRFLPLLLSFLLCSLLIGCSGEMDSTYEYEEPMGETASDGSSTSETADDSSEDTQTTDQEPIQAGTLTAGDYDDSLNPEMFKTYLDKILQGSSVFEDFPIVDILNRVVINVTDLDGAPFINATMQVTSETSTQSYRFPNSGQLSLYPTLESLGNAFTISVSSSDGAITHSQEIEIEQLDDPRTVNVVLEGYSTAVEQLDLMVVIDTTGSMGDELDYLKVELQSILNEIQVTVGDLDVRLGLTVYRDIGDVYVTQTYDLTSDVEALVQTLSEQSHDGGGDYPEAMDRALDDAMAQAWRDTSTKVILLIADAPPHNENLLDVWEKGLEARHKQIHIVPVAASGVALKAEFLMRSLALLTQSRYIFITDDSGIGNSHQEPDADCYVVTRLDSTIRRVLSSIVQGQRVEPEASEVIREKGNYDAGVCLLE